MNDIRFSTDIILLYVNPTDKCNATCPYCYLPDEIKSRKKSMSYAELKQIVEKTIDFFDKKGTKGVIVFHGSEPLMNRENIFRIISEYHGELNFGIQTNGLLLTEEDARFIMKNDVNIGISLDSPDEETNDFLRGQGHYKKVIMAFDYFKDYKGLNVVTTITRYNQGQLADMVGFLGEKGIKMCLMNPVRGTQKESLPFRPDPEELADEFINAVDAAIEITKSGRRMVIGDFANILLGIIAPGARVLMCDISPCGGGRRFFAITADGKSYPCGEFIGMEEFSGGNIFSDSIEDIIGSDGLEKVRKRIVEKIDECDTCVLMNICGASCPAEIYSTEGSMFRKSYYCKFYKKVIEHAFRVILRGDVWHVIRKSALKERFDIAKLSMTPK